MSVEKAGLRARLGGRQPVLRPSPLTMQVDYSVELGRDDETLEFPWTTHDGRLWYFDLKRDPEAVAQIEEAVRAEELRDFLLAANAPLSMLETAKCDIWSTTELNPEEEIFSAPWKFASYVDFLFSDPAARFSLEKHESFLKNLTALLKRVPEIPAAADFFLRRCFYQKKSFVEEGFYVTFYLFGYGQDEAKARKQWGIALNLVAAAITQLSVGNSSL